MQLKVGTCRASLNLSRCTINRFVFAYESSDRTSSMLSRSFRASKTFTTFVISFAIFTDILLQNLVVPVLPYALRTRIGLEDEADVQKWTSILLAAFGASLMMGCCT